MSMTIVRCTVVMGMALTVTSLLPAGVGPQTQAAWSVRFLLGQGPCYVPGDSEKQLSLMLGSPEADFGLVVDTPSDANASGVPWSEPVQGIRVRLRAEKQTWTGVEAPRLWMDVRNTESPTNQVLAIPGSAYLLQVDGAWFRLLVGGRSQDLIRGKDLLDLPIELNRYWLSIDDTHAQRLLQSGGRGEGIFQSLQAHLLLRPGKHLVRVALLTSPKTVSDRPGWSILSNAVEIEIVSSGPDDNAWAGNILWGQPVDGLRLGVDYVGRGSWTFSKGVEFLLYVANRSEKSVTLVRSAPGTSELAECTPRVADASGRTVEVTIPPMDTKAGKQNLILKPGDVQLLGATSLGIEPATEPTRPAPYSPLGPGTYSITETYRFSDDPAATWHGELTSGPVKLLVEPPAKK